MSFFLLNILTFRNDKSYKNIKSSFKRNCDMYVYISNNFTILFRSQINFDLPLFRNLIDNYYRSVNRFNMFKAFKNKRISERNVTLMEWNNWRCFMRTDTTMRNLNNFRNVPFHRLNIPGDS